MRAVRVGEPGTVRVTDVPEPRLKDPRDAVVKVTAAAICGADLFPISDRERLMRMVLDRKLEPERVVSHRMAMDDAAQAYQLFDKRVATKAVLYA